MVMVPRDVAYAYAYAYAYLGESEMQRQSGVGPRAATILVSSYSVHTRVYSQFSPEDRLRFALLQLLCRSLRRASHPRLIRIRANP